MDGAGNPNRVVKRDCVAAATSRGGALARSGAAQPGAPGRQREPPDGASIRTSDFERAAREFREYYDASIAILRDAESSLRAQIVSVLADQPAFATPHVVSRIKAREERLHKFQRKYLPQLAEARAPYVISDHIADLTPGSPSRRAARAARRVAGNLTARQSGPKAPESRDCAGRVDLGRSGDGAEESAQGA